MNNSAARGGALYSIDTVIEDCIFSNNTASQSGDGIYPDSDDDYQSDNDDYLAGEDASNGTTSKSAASKNDDSTTGNPIALLLICLIAPILTFIKFKR